MRGQTGKNSRGGAKIMELASQLQADIGAVTVSQAEVNYHGLYATRSMDTHNTYGILLK